MDKDKDHLLLIFHINYIVIQRVSYRKIETINSLLLSACVVAVSTAILGDLEAGLTAGSYTLAITTLGLAVLTFLSAIF